MRILALGDFHGKFPRRLPSIVKKEKIDVVVSVGDYPSFTLKKIMFATVYGRDDLELWDVIGKKKYKKAMKKDFDSSQKVLKQLNKLPVPVLTVVGNHDYQYSDDSWDKEYYNIKKWPWEKKRRKAIAESIAKYGNMTRFDYKAARFGDYVFIGARGYSHPGKVQSKAYKKYKKILERLFKKYSRGNKEKKVIFVAHNSPYNTKLDKITAKDAHKLAKGKHYGSKMFRRVIDKFQPVLSISGHIEEGCGTQKLGKTLAVNTGSAHHGDAYIIEIGKTVKAKLIKLYYGRGG